MGILSITLVVAKGWVKKLVEEGTSLFETSTNYSVVVVVTGAITISSLTTP